MENNVKTWKIKEIFRWVEEIILGGEVMIIECGRSGGRKETWQPNARDPNQNCILYFTIVLMYIAHFTVIIAHNTMYNENCTQQSSLYTVHYTLHSTHPICTPYTEHQP